MKNKKECFTQSEKTVVKFQTGFTLIEMLMVTAMLAVVSLAIYATFSNGIKIYQRLHMRVLEEDLSIVLDKFSRDLHNVVNFESIQFLGKAESVEFVTLVNSQQLDKTTIGKVEYFYDSGEETFSRRKSDYSQIFNKRPDKYLESVERIESLVFKYYVYSEEEKKYFWLEEVSEIPIAVRVKLKLNNGSRIVEFQKTVSIPIAG